MPIIIPHPTIPEAAFIEIEAEKYAVYGARHSLLDREVVACLKLDYFTNLGMTSIELGTYLMICDPTWSGAPRIIFANGGVFHVVLIDKIGDATLLWASTEGKDDVRPTRGLLVPAYMEVGIQSLQHNRTTFTVLGHCDDKVEAGTSFDDPLIANLWERQAGSRAASVTTGRYLK